jgi:hypothetical protein
MRNEANLHKSVRCEVSSLKRENQSCETNPISNALVAAAPHCSTIPSFQHSSLRPKAQVDSRQTKPIPLERREGQVLCGKEVMVNWTCNRLRQNKANLSIADCGLDTDLRRDAPCGLPPRTRAGRSCKTNPICLRTGRQGRGWSQSCKTNPILPPNRQRGLWNRAKRTQFAAGVRRGKYLVGKGVMPNWTHKGPRQNEANSPAHGSGRWPASLPAPPVASVVQTNPICRRGQERPAAKAFGLDDATPAGTNVQNEANSPRAAPRASALWRKSYDQLGRHGASARQSQFRGGQAWARAGKGWRGRLYKQSQFTPDRPGGTPATRATGAAATRDKRAKQSQFPAWAGNFLWCWESRHYNG